jgi:hypothetical protein
MSKREEVLKDLMKICSDAIDPDDMTADREDTYLDTCAYKALFNYTSISNLKKLKEYVLYDIKKFGGK